MWFHDFIPEVVAKLVLLLDDPPGHADIIDLYQSDPYWSLKLDDLGVCVFWFAEDLHHEAVFGGEDFEVLRAEPVVDELEKMEIIAGGLGGQ
jgi:hypothetical protein